MNMDDNQRRGIAGIILLVAPIFCVTVVALAYIVLFAYGDAGIAAAGPMARMTYVGCPEAQAVVAARVETMGLPDPEFKTTEDGFQLTSRLPGERRVVERFPDPRHVGAPAGAAGHRRRRARRGLGRRDRPGVRHGLHGVPRYARAVASGQAAERCSRATCHVHQRIAAFVEGKKIGEYRNISHQPGESTSTCPRATTSRDGLCGGDGDHPR